MRGLGEVLCRACLARGFDLQRLAREMELPQQALLVYLVVGFARALRGAWSVHGYCALCQMRRAGVA